MARKVEDDMQGSEIVMTINLMHFSLPILRERIIHLHAYQRVLKKFKKDFTFTAVIYCLNILFYILIKLSTAQTNFQLNHT